MVYNGSELEAVLEPVKGRMSPLEMRVIIEEADEISVRRCDVCGRFMAEGYVINDGEEYFCSDGCRRKRMPDEEYGKLYDEGCAYYTEWENHPDVIERLNEAVDG